MSIKTVYTDDEENTQLDIEYEKGLIELNQWIGDENVGRVVITKEDLDSVVEFVEGSKSDE